MPMARMLVRVLPADSNFLDGLIDAGFDGGDEVERVVRVPSVDLAGLFRKMGDSR